jgi:hypothetical protein
VNKLHGVGRSRPSGVFSDLRRWNKLALVKGNFGERL